MDHGNAAIGVLGSFLVEIKPISFCRLMGIYDPDTVK
jgi:hypothetical protein